MSIIQGNTKVSAGGYEIDQSIRFNASDSAYMSTSFGTPTSGNTITLSGWFKRADLARAQYLWDNRAGAGAAFSVRFDTSDTISIFMNSAQRTTDAVFRDPAAHYHIFITMEGAAPRLWINNEEITSWGTDSGSWTGTNRWNTASGTHVIGRYQYGASNYYGGLASELYFIDGTALDPTDLGETNNDGVWVPKAYSGAYGNNGFYITGATAGDLGEDFSGNNNDFTSSGLAADDQRGDTPTANHATWNPLFFRRTGSYKPVFANGNLYVAGQSSQVSHTGTTIASTGKHYAEFLVNNGSSTITGPGVIRTLWDGGLAQSYASNFSGSYYGDNGGRYYNATGDTQTAPGSNRVGIEVDFANDEVEYFIVTSGGTKTSQGGKLTSANGIDFDGEGIFTATLHNNSSRNITAYFEEADWWGTPSAGYKALSTANLPTPAIADGSKHFQTTLYTGNGTAIGSGGLAVSQSENSTFQPDFVWIKKRSGATEHVLTDAVRGVTKELSSNDTGAEETVTEGLTTFGSAGFTVGSDGSYNTSSATYAGWQWKANGAGSSNTDGTITSTVSANTTAGFSIVRAASMATGTIGHGLSQAPDMVIGRMQSAVFNWWVWHRDLTGGTYSMKLNDNSAQAAVATVYTAEPTSTVINTGVSWTSGNPAIFYCFHEVEGFSKFGKYTGNGSTDGPFIFTGFRPAFVMFKKTSGTDSWEILDNTRPGYNVTGLGLFPNATNSESTGRNIDILSNGIKQRNANGTTNEGGNTYIYMAFAENPFGGDGVAPVPAR